MAFVRPCLLSIRIWVYIPWKPGTLFYREGYPNTAWFMQDVVERICDLASAAPALSPMVELTLSGRGPGPGPGVMVVQLVNTSGHHGNSFYAPLPIRDLQLEIPLDDAAARVRAVRTLRRGGDLPWTVEDGAGKGGLIKLSLPLLEAYEAVVIELDSRRD